MKSRKISVIHKDSFENEIHSTYEGYFEVNYGGCLVICEHFGGFPKAIFAKPYWIGVEYVEV